MTCASCAARVERRLNGLDGVAASVNYATESASVAFDPGRVAPERLVEAVQEAGYERASPRAARPPGTRCRATGAPAPAPARRLGGPLAAGPPDVDGPGAAFDGWEWSALALAAPVVLWGGWPFHRAAWASLRHGAATMDTLISLGTLAALGWSARGRVPAPTRTSTSRSRPW